MNLGKVSSDQSKKQSSIRQSFDFKLHNLTSSLAGANQKRAVIINQFKTSKDSFNVKTTLNTIENEEKRKLQRNKSIVNTISEANRVSRQNSETQRKVAIKVSFIDKPQDNSKKSASRQGGSKLVSIGNQKMAKTMNTMSSPGSKTNLLPQKKNNGAKLDLKNVTKQFDRKPSNPNPGFKQKIIRQASASVVGTNMMKKMLLDHSDDFNHNQNQMNKYIDKEIIFESDSKDFVEEDEIKKRVGNAPVNTYLVTNFNQTYKGKTINKIQSSSRLDEYKTKDKQSYSSAKFPSIRANHSPSTTDRKLVESKNKLTMMASSKKIPSCPVTTTNKNEKSPPKTHSK